MWFPRYACSVGRFFPFSGGRHGVSGRVACLALGAGSLPLWAQAPARAVTPTSASESGIADPKLDARVESLLRSMTLEEKIGQLVQYSAGQATGPGTGRTDYKDMIGRGQIGALLNVIETPLINEYQHIAVEKSRLHIPLLFGLDVIHGYRTEFPIPLGMASTWILLCRESIACSGGGSVRDWDSVDVLADGGYRAGCAVGRIQEGAGEDPYLGSAMAAAYVRGYQGLHLTRRIRWRRAPNTM